MGEKERWMDRSYDKRSTSSWRNRPIGQVRVSKEPILKQSMPMPENQAWIAPTSVCSCCDSDDLCEKSMWSYWYTENWVRGLWQLGVERYDFHFAYWKDINVSTLCSKSLLPVTWPRRGVAINYLLSKIFQNVETDGSLFQNFSRFFVRPRSHAGQYNALLSTPSKIPLHAIQKCRQHWTCSLGLP